ncbi:MAG: hypothetical protein ACOYYS_07380 [Chloroflexota bacterium]
MKKRLSLSIETLWAATVLIGVFAFANTHPLRPHDFWFHAAVGREIVSTGEIPEVDTFSYTAAGQPYDSYKSFWLMEVLLYTLYTWGGAVGVVFVHGLMITAAYVVTFVAGWRASRSVRAGALGALFAAALGINDWNVRPQAIAFVIGALFLWAIDALQYGGRRAWLLVFPLGMLVWVNSHGSFVMGLALLGAWFAANMVSVFRARFYETAQAPVARQQRPREVSSLYSSGLALTLASLACLLNPRGLGVLRYVGGMAANPVIQNMVPEWAAPGLDTLGGRLFYIGLSFALLLLLFSLRRSRVFQWLVFLGFAALGLQTMRGSVWFGLFLAPTVAFHLAGIGKNLVKRFPPHPDEKPAPPVLNGIILAFLLLLGFVSLPWFKESLPFPPPKAGLISYETPVRATQVLLENDWPGYVFHAMSFGSYLDWAAQPEYPVFVDSRIELYPVSVWQDYIEISAALAGWEDELAAYGVNTLMLSPFEQAGLVAAVRVSAHWQLVYEDTAALVFVRQP